MTNNHVIFQSALCQVIGSAYFQASNIVSVNNSAMFGGGFEVQNVAMFLLEDLRLEGNRGKMETSCLNIQFSTGSLRNSQFYFNRDFPVITALASNIAVDNIDLKGDSNQHSSKGFMLQASNVTLTNSKFEAIIGGKVSIKGHFFFVQFRCELKILNTIF